MSTQQERARALDEMAVPGVGAANREELIARDERRLQRDRRRREHEDQKLARKQISSRELAKTSRLERNAERRCREAVMSARAERAKDRRWWRAGDERTLMDRVAAATIGDTRPLWAEQTPHKTTTANSAAIFPFYNEGGVGHRGVVVGLNLLGGGAFCFDPWNLYTSTSFSRVAKGERIIKNGNMIVLGSPGEGKSSLVKTMAYRQAAFGRRCEFIDPKGEYGDVVNALGGVVVKLSPGGEQALNPLTDVGDPRSRRNLLVSLSRALLGRSLTSVEKTGILAALDQADREAQGRYEVCLPHVEAALRAPSTELAERVNGTPDFAVEHLRELMLELQLLSDGPLAGMFDRPTTIPASTWDQDAISIDLSAIAALAGADDEGQNQPLAITMMCCSAFLSARADQRAARCKRESLPIPKTMRVNDEGWRVLAVPGQAQQYQADFKLQRASGVVNVVVMHRLSDLRAAGDDGSRAKKLAEGLRADADTIVIYRQDEGELADLAEQLKLSVSELDVVRNLNQAQALWQVGKWHGVVQHLRSSVEEEISNTDEAMSTAPRSRRTPTAGAGPEEDDLEQLDMLELLDDEEDPGSEDTEPVASNRVVLAEEDLPAGRPRLVVDAEELDEAGEH